jgi:hypothetical protein
MNKKQKNIRNSLNLLDRKYRLDKNSVRINTHNLITHEIGKLIKAYELIKEGHEVYTEVTFKNGGIADVLDACHMRVYEVLCSEKLSDAKIKTQKYPEELDICYVEV